MAIKIRLVFPACLFLLLLASCVSLVGLQAVAADKLPTNEQPMYGGIENNQIIKDSNAKLLEEVYKHGLTPEQGSAHAAKQGWDYYYEGDLSTAMKRFNQSWLLNSENGDAYYGFALVTLARNGDAAEADKYFKIAVSKPAVHIGALVDYGLFLLKSHRDVEGLQQLNQALERNPKARQARAHIAIYYSQQRDFTKACEWGQLAQANGDQLPQGFIREMCDHAIKQ